MRTIKRGATSLAVIVTFGAFAAGPASASPQLSTPVGGLNSVSCGRPSGCVAIGSAKRAPLIALSWSGRAWAATGAPKSAILSAVDCTGSTFCMAGGDSSTGPVRAWGEIWNGSTWKNAPAPLPAPRHLTSFGSVSCVTPTACLGVGLAENRSAATFTYAALWHGTTWKVIPSPNPGQESEFSAVSCWAANGCLAVGEDLNHGIAAAWNGSSWTLTPPPAALSVPVAVSCAGRFDCWATGYGSGLIPHAAHWNGTAWKLYTFSRSLFALYGIACPATNDCMAVGTGAKGAGVPASEHWDGTSWTAVSPASPGSGIESQLSSVSCTGASACVAAGTAIVNPGQPGEVSHQFAEAWNGTSWRITPLP
jgi:hypothetical protein